MSKAEKKPARGFIYGEYCTWSDDGRYELINGEVFDMTPGPGRLHQEISMELATWLHSFFKDKPCKVYASPFDVRLPNRKEADEDIKTVVQPDFSSSATNRSSMTKAVAEPRI